MKAARWALCAVAGAAIGQAWHLKAEAFDPMTPAQILANAAPGVGYSYWWGHGRWDPAARTYPGACAANKGSTGCPGCSHSATGSGPEYGADCSGFVAKVWQVPNAVAMTTDGHPYRALSFMSDTAYWKRVSREDWAPGDALASSTHVMLFEGWTAGGKALVYECAGCSKGCIHRARTIGSNYVGARRVGTTSAAKQPTGKLETAQCGAVAGWAYDPNQASKTVEVSVYFGGPLGDAKATLVKTTANIRRDDLCKSLGSCEHGFRVPIPDEYQDGESHPVYVYTADVSGTLRKTALAGSPQHVACAISCPALASKRKWYGYACESEGDGACGGDGARTQDCDRCCGSTCADDTECGSNVCAWNGHVYCCRPAPGSGEACTSDHECGSGMACSWNGQGFVCATPQCADQ